MNVAGLVIGLSCFVIIGVFHPVVIKCEYYLGAKVWPVFLVLGLLSLGVSLAVEDVILSGIAGVFGCCSLWSIGELKKQEERVAKGWFPRNPKRRQSVI